MTFDRFDDVLVKRLLRALPPEANAYLFGSRVYDAHSIQSDHDFQVIVADKKLKEFTSKPSINSRFTDLHVHSQTEFQDALNKHEPYAVETFFLPREFRFVEGLKLTFVLDKKKMRHAFSENASHSWVKGKKKLTVPESLNEWIGKKSIYHAFRMIDYAIQIGETGMISNYASCNDILVELSEMGSDWTTIDATMRPRFNALMTKFREVCPK